MQNYRLLRQRIKDEGYGITELSEWLGRSCTYISCCMAGRSDWRMSEVYKLAKKLGIPKHEIWLYWPIDGKLVQDHEMPVQKTGPEAVLRELGKLLKQYAG